VTARAGYSASQVRQNEAARLQQIAMFNARQPPPVVVNQVGGWVIVHLRGKPITAV
jgi:hypothetical protein